MKKYIILGIWYLLIVSSIIAGPKEIKIIFSILCGLTTIIVVPYFIIRYKISENKKGFEDWQLTEYGFIAESHKELKKRKKLYKEIKNAKDN